MKPSFILIPQDSEDHDYCFAIHALRPVVDSAMRTPDLADKDDTVMIGELICHKNGFYDNEVKLVSGEGATLTCMFRTVEFIGNWIANNPVH